MWRSADKWWSEKWCTLYANDHNAGAGPHIVKVFHYTAFWYTISYFMLYFLEILSFIEQTRLSLIVVEHYCNRLLNIIRVYIKYN